MDESTRHDDLVEERARTGSLGKKLTRRRFVFTTSAAVAAALLASCGSDDDPDIDPTAPTSGGDEPAATEGSGDENTPATEEEPTSPADAQATEPVGEATSGGRAVIALIQEPGQMNEFFNAQSGSGLSILAVEPLFTPDASGNYLPILAAEVPTLENGGISEDLLTITYTLKEGLTWSDGEPFTA
ncbi:hypothetical protein BH23CHL1_BH23CHL1_26810 [soil metagenome]